MTLQTLSVRLDDSECKQLELMAAACNRDRDSHASDLLRAAVYCRGLSSFAAKLFELATSRETLPPHVREAIDTICEIANASDKRFSAWTPMNCLVHALERMTPEQRWMSVRKAIRFGPESSFEEAVAVGAIRLLLAECWEELFSMPLPFAPVRQYCAGRLSATLRLRLSQMAFREASMLRDGIEALLLHLHRYVGNPPARSVYGLKRDLYPNP